MSFRSLFWLRVKKALVIGIALVFAFSMVRSFVPPDDRLPQGMEVPAARLQTLSGGQGPLDPSAFEGKALLLNFWATWCGPCKAEIPALQSLHERYGGEDFAVIGITSESPGRVRAFVDKTNMTYPIVRDSGGRFGDRFGVDTIPFSVFVGPDGRIAGDITGELDADEGAERIEKLIAAARQMK